jgi:hypothetical protein
MKVGDTVKLIGLPPSTDDDEELQIPGLSLIRTRA